MQHDCEPSYDFVSQARKLYAPLRPAEISVIETVERGQKATLPRPASSSQHAHTMRSKLLRWLIIAVNENKNLCNSGVQIPRATFDEGLQLQNMHFTIPLCLTSCTIDGELDLRNTHAGQLDFEDSHVTSLIRACNLHVSGDLCLNGDFKAEHGLYMANAAISGNFDCRGAQFSSMSPHDFRRLDDHPFDDGIPSHSYDPGMPSIVANGLQTGGSVLLSGIKPTHKVTRNVARHSTELDSKPPFIRHLEDECIDDKRHCPRNCPIMNHSNQFLSLEDDNSQDSWSSGKPFEADGTIYLMSAMIKGLLRVSCARLNSNGVYALRADAMKTGGSVIFRGVDVVAGQIRLTNVSVGNKLEFSGGVFCGPEKDIVNHVKQPFKKAAIYLDEIHIGTDLLITHKFESKSEFRMIGAHIDGNMSVDDATFNTHSSWQDGVALSMSGSNIGGKVGIYRNAKFNGTIHMPYCRISGELFISASAKSAVGDNNNMATPKYLDNQHAISAQCTEVSGDAKLGLCEDEGELKDQGEPKDRQCSIGHSINMTNMSIGKNLVFGKMVIGGNYPPISVTYNGYKGLPKAIRLDGAKVAGSINFKPGCEIRGTVDLEDASIGSNLRLSGARLRTPDGWPPYTESDTESELITLSADRVNVTGNVFLSDGFRADEHIRLPGANIGGSLFMNNKAVFKKVDLTSAKIAGELHLGSFPKNDKPEWVAHSRMVLRNTSVEAIQDADDLKADDTKSWPEALELEGFTYRRLGGTDTRTDAAVSMPTRSKSTKWFINWLNRDNTYSPHPYEYLAGLLKDSGYTSKANAVLYASRERSRKMKLELWKQHREWRHWWGWFGMSLLDLTIGYGIGRRYFKALYTVAAFTAIGFLLLLVSVPANDIQDKTWGLVHVSQTDRNISENNRDTVQMFWTSFDYIIPIVKLDDVRHTKLIDSTKGEWGNVVIGYFYVHKLVGYVLAGFLTAGLAGLTQKQK